MALKPFYNKKKKLDYTAEQVNTAVGNALNNADGKIVAITLSGSAISSLKVNNVETETDILFTEEGAALLSAGLVTVKSGSTTYRFIGNWIIGLDGHLISQGIYWYVENVSDFYSGGYTANVPNASSFSVQLYS